MSRFRRLKEALREVLAREDFEEALRAYDAPPDTLTSPLFSLRLDRDELVRWRAATGLGVMAARLADETPEKARVLMRSFMWQMNEESGNLGWGIPESMAESMVRHAGLAKEFHTILASYIYTSPDRDGNYLDHAELRRGVYWGLGRLAEVRPQMVTHAVADLAQGLGENDAHNRGYTAWALGVLAGKGIDVAHYRDALETLLDDQAPVRMYRGGDVEETDVAGLAREALERMG